ncbi:hypothetical protein [uncultured Leptotrichia sp.]|uniref:hypothetical protein n=1 Tax=uncultured Leptotrichia sp. TaxID=159271 RepID=UPI0026292353|nr:hypothetical protein [uncultured Leptotrichia sp.]
MKNKDILNFNKGIALEIKQIVERCQKYEKELTFENAKRKGLFLEVQNEGESIQSYLVKNTDYLRELIESEKIKLHLENRVWKEYFFDDLKIIENIKKKSYKVFLLQEVFNLHYYESEYESLEDFLNGYIKEV